MVEERSPDALDRPGPFVSRFLMQRNVGGGGAPRVIKNVTTHISHENNTKPLRLCLGCLNCAEFIIQEKKC